MYNICDVLLDKSRFNLTTLPWFDILEYYKSFKPITTTIWKACNTEIGRNTLSSMNCYRYLLKNVTSILYKILSNIDISYNVHCTRQYLTDVYHVRTVTDIFYELLHISWANCTNLIEVGTKILQGMAKETVDVWIWGIYHSLHEYS